MDVDDTVSSQPPAKDGVTAAKSEEIPVPASTKTPATAATTPKKYTAPVDPTTGDLLPECIMYLRLLLLLANLDAGFTQQVSLFGLWCAVC